MSVPSAVHGHEVAKNTGKKMKFGVSTVMLNL